MRGYDWLIALHVLSAIVLIGSLTALWTLVLATRPSSPTVEAASARTYGRIAGPLVGVGMMGTILLGIWLAIASDDYQLWDVWVLASLVLWAFAGWAGGRAGREFEQDPVGRRPAGIRYQTLTSLAVLAILVLMIWKPGA